MITVGGYNVWDEANNSDNYVNETKKATGTTGSFDAIEYSLKHGGKILPDPPANPEGNGGRYSTGLEALLVALGFKDLPSKDTSDTDDTNPPEGTYGPPAPDWFTNPDGTGGKNFIDNLFTRGSMLPGDENTQTGLLGVLAQTFANVKADIIAAAKDGVSDGLSGVTITATVSTGNVILDTGEIVGSITPQVNYQLGTTATHEGRA